MPFSDTAWDAAGNKTWGDSIAAYSESRPVAIIGNKFYQFDAGLGFNNGDVEVNLTRTGLALLMDRFGEWQVDPLSEKELQEIWPVFKAPSGTVINLWAGSQEDPEGEITWEGPYPFIVGTSSFQDFIITGRYLAVRFTSLGQPSWELIAYNLNIEKVGG